MTGKEKIALLVHEIDKAHQELITGNKVRIYSGSFTDRGITLDEQKQILDILANEKRVIKYSQSDVYETEDDIEFTYLKKLWATE